MSRGPGPSAATLKLCSSATATKAARSWKACGVEKDVAFIDADHGLDDQIDAAYHRKYRRHGAQYVDLVVTPEARSTTIKLVPRQASG
jgi:hypothetical protein